VKFPPPALPRLRRRLAFLLQPGESDRVEEGRFNNGSARKNGTMFANFDGLVVLIDLGMSRASTTAKARC
jgi:hypothetical protein